MKPLPLLDVHRPSSRSGRLKQIRLTRQKRGNLERIDYFDGRRTLIGKMHIGDDSQPCLLAHASECIKTAVEPWTAGSAGIRPVSLVEARLENDSTGHAGLQARYFRRDAHVQGIVFDDTRTGDHEQPVPRE
jgi:hypothetical protein